MAYADIYNFNPENTNLNHHSSYYVVEQNTYPATTNMNGSQNQLVFINQPYQSQNQDCNSYSYYSSSNSSSSNSNMIQQQNQSMNYGSSKQNQVFYSNAPVREFINNYPSSAPHSNILVHESHTLSTPSTSSTTTRSEGYAFHATGNNQSYPLMTPSPQLSDYHSSFNTTSEKNNNIFIIQPIRSTPSHSSSSFSSDESSVYLFEEENIRSRKLNYIKNDKKRKNTSSMSEKKHLCPYCEHR